MASQALRSEFNCVSKVQGLGGFTGSYVCFIRVSETFQDVSGDFRKAFVDFSGSKMSYTKIKGF